MSKPRVAIFDFACCEGCQLQIVNLEEELLDLLTIVTPVEWREAMSERSDTYDVAIVEGSVTRPDDAERLRQIRARAGTLVALGACATIGGVNRIKNRFNLAEAGRCVYGEAACLPHLQMAKTRVLHEIVKVDYMIHGCPIDGCEFASAVRALVRGQAPFVPSYPVCVECKRKGIVCRYEYNEICLGPVTRAGCGARCPSKGAWCFGCRGLVDDPNVQAAREVMEFYHKTAADLQDRLDLFNAEREAAHA